MRKPEYGVAKEKIPADWIEARKHIDAQFVFKVEHWFYPYLVVLAIVLFTASWIYNELWLAVVAGVLAVGLSWWNKHTLP